MTHDRSLNYDEKGNWHSDILRQVTMPLTPEQQARQKIDVALAEAGWLIQDRGEMNLAAGLGVVVREFRMAPGHGFADYMLFVDGQAAGVLEAKPVEYTLSSVELQADKYATGLPAGLNPPVNPLPFLYVSTGVDTRFINGLDPDPKSRRISHLPHIHRPETLADWVKAETLDAWTKRLHLEGGGVYTAADETRPSSLRGRIQTLPELEQDFLYPVQVEAVGNVDWSLKRNHPRSLVQMATGSGKTIFAITSAYRLIRYAGARRVLFLVDRSNLGEQAEKEFQGFRTPDDHRKFTELYTVQRLTSNTIGAASKVVITTIQRLYSMLKGEPDFAAEDEASSQFESTGGGLSEPLPVVYNAAYPPEYFDVIVIDECHRSIYSVWRQVLEYFDAFLIGLTATPAKQTFGVFNKNLVMEYDHERAVADGVNVDFEVYNIRTRITGQGATIEATPDTMVQYRDRQTRQRRWERPDEDITYDAAQLDRGVVARDQIRTVVRTFRDRLFMDIFPGRKAVPKTLIFAKDDSHAEDIVEIDRGGRERGSEAEGEVAGRLVRAVHRRQQGRDRRPPVLLRAAVRDAAPLRRPQGAGRRDQGAPARLDAGEALACLRDARQGPGAGRSSAAAAHRPRLSRPVRDEPRGGAGAVRRARPGAFRPLARTAAHRRPRLQARPGPVAGDDPRPHRGERGDDGGGSRLRAVRGGGRPRSRGAGVRQAARAAAE